MEREFVFLKACGSTNTLLKETVRESAGPSFAVLSAESQTGGRGRRGNSFYSPAGGAYFSAAYPLTGTETHAPFLTLLAGLAAAEALEALSSAHILLKWPNDLYLHGKKLGGILTELVSAPSRNTAVVGFGINLLLQKDSFPPELRDKMTSLAAEGVTAPGTEALVRETVRRLDAFVYAENALCGDISPYAQKINERSFLTGKQITVTGGNETVSGTAGAIAPDGRLLLFTKEGERKIFSGSVEIC